MVGWVLFMCSRDTLTDIFFRKICSWPTLNTCSAENVGKSQFSCAVYNVLKATFKLLEPFYHPIISFLHLKACLTLEKYTELDSQAAVKPKDILGNCWPFPSSSGESCRDVVWAQTPQKTWSRTLVHERPMKEPPRAPPSPILLQWNQKCSRQSWSCKTGWNGERFLEKSRWRWCFGSMFSGALGCAEGFKHGKQRDFYLDYFFP